MNSQTIRARICRGGRIMAGAFAALLLTAPAASAQDADNPFGECHLDFSLSSIKAMVTNPVTGERTLSGQVIAICDGTQLYADEVRWSDKTIFAGGNLLVVQEGLRVTADRVEMDRATRLGTFWNAYGTARLTDEQPDRNLFGTLEPEVMFRAERIERIGSRQYRMTNGWFTTCLQPDPRWAMSGSSGTITLDDSVSLRNVLFKVKKVPVLYLPYLYYPLGKDDRKTGFLIPTYSNSNIRGPGVSAAFFWAINRSQDATIYWDGYWQYGQGTAVDYRYQSSHADSGNLRVSSFWEREMVLDNGTPRAAKRTWDVVGRVNQSLGGGFHLVGEADYFSDPISQQLYQQSSMQYTQSARRLNLAIVGDLRVGAVPLRLEGKYLQEDIFIDLTRLRRLGRTPEVRAFISQKEIAGSGSVMPVSVGAFAEVVNLDVRPDLENPALDQRHWRADGSVTVRAPFRGLDFVKVIPSVTWRLTNWSETLDPVSRTPVPLALTRNLFNFQLQTIGPSLERTWRTPENGFASGFRHIIEPRLTTQWITAFDSIDRVILVDHGIDDQVGGTVALSYSLKNGIWASVRQEGGSTTVREIASVDIGQSYYSNAAAGVSDPQYLTPTFTNFKDIWIKANVRPTTRLTGEFQMFINPVVMQPWSYAAGARIDATYVQLFAGWSKVRSFPNVPALSDPNRESHFLNGLSSVKILKGKIGVSYGFNWDIRQQVLLDQRIIANYVAQCCGFAFDYQVRGLAHLVGSGAPPVDRRWTFSVTLAGIGTFSNPFGSFQQ